MNFQEPIGGLVERIARALERLAPAPPRKPDFDRAQAFVWQAEPEAFLAVANVNRVPLPLLKGIDGMRDVLFDNTVRFARGLPANNALLWGARGMGKSSLVKAVHAAVSREPSAKAGDLKLIEIHREDIGTLPRCLAQLRETRGKRFILFCDDLSFEAPDTSYKSLKAVLEGGIEGRPGLWIGFHNCSQDSYLDMVRGYAAHYRLPIEDEALTREALAWAIGRGARSGRVAFQYIQDLAGRLGVRLDGLS